METRTAAAATLEWVDEFPATVADVPQVTAVAAVIPRPAAMVAAVDLPTGAVVRIVVEATAVTANGFRHAQLRACRANVSLPRWDASISRPPFFVLVKPAEDQ